MEFNAEIRKKQLQSLDEYISSTNKRIQHVVHSLKWKEKDVLKGETKTTCMFNHNHRIPLQSVEAHYEKCSLKSQGYDLREPFLSEPQENIRNSIIISDQKKTELIAAAHKNDWQFRTGWNGRESDPKTSDRFTSAFTADERLLLYNYTIENTERPQILPDYNILYQKTERDQPLTYEEMCIKERDSKRRRIKYKAVHTNHKSHTEIMQEVIKNEMEQYQDWLLENDQAEGQTDSQNRRDQRHASIGSSRHSHSGRESTKSHKSKKSGSSNHKCDDRDYNDSNHPNERKAKREYSSRNDEECDTSYRSRYYRHESRSKYTDRHNSRSYRSRSRTRKRSRGRSNGHRSYDSDESQYYKQTRQRESYHDYKGKRRDANDHWDESKNNLVCNEDRSTKHGSRKSVKGESDKVSDNSYHHIKEEKTRNSNSGENYKKNSHNNGVYHRNSGGGGDWNSNEYKCSSRARIEKSEK